MPEAKSLPQYLDLILLSVAIAAGYIWLQLPLLQPFSLQGFAFAILIFFGLKFFSRQRNQVLAGMATFELVPLVFALLLLIGATNASQSSYFSLLYVFLLLLVLTSGTYTSIIITGELALALYALSVRLGLSDWQQLLSLPLMLGFFLYIKYQLAVSNRQREELAVSASRLTMLNLLLDTVAQQKSTLEYFIREFLKPKLVTLARLGQDQLTTKRELLSQLDLLENEIDKVLSRPDQVTPVNPFTVAPPELASPSEPEATV